MPREGDVLHSFPRALPRALPHVCVPSVTLFREAVLCHYTVVNELSLKWVCGKVRSAEALKVRSRGISTCRYHRNHTTLSDCVRKTVTVTMEMHGDFTRAPGELTQGGRKKPPNMLSAKSNKEKNSNEYGGGGPPRGRPWR